MISLRPMRPDEFTAYLDYFIRDYGAEISTNYGLSDVDARAQAIREIDEDLPQGTKTAGQVLLCIIAGASTVIGYLWYRQDLAARSAFISDFHIFTGKQGNGYGKQALALLERQLADSGYAQIRLRVAADNDRARHVYDRSGFRVTGINMSKTITQ
jgi:ribosomal protein S18 acetylase RimI-like enzyme